MFLPISCIFIGIALGLLLKRTVLPRLADRLFMPIVCALLFAMGYVTGGNAELMANLPTLGLQALLLAVAAIIGSVVCVCLLCRILPTPDGGVPGKANGAPHAGAGNVRPQGKGPVAGEGAVRAGGRFPGGPQ